jgi:hypothetical protein
MHALIKGLVLVCALAGSMFWGRHLAQDDKKQDAKDGKMPAIALTPEHKWLAEGAGTWKATGKMMTGPGTFVPMNGVQTNTMQLGGLWQIQDYKDDKGGFAGHGIAGYDAVKKKFVAVWVDNLMGELSPAEGTLSDDKKTLTLTFSMSEPGGEKMTMTETVTRKDPKTELFELSMPGPDGKSVKVVEITYTKM